MTVYNSADDDNRLFDQTSRHRDRYALGSLKGGEEGAELRRAALEFLSGLGVVAPLTQLRGYYPELIV